jgi:hypothetical protein
VAEYPGADPREITGLKNKADVDDWINVSAVLGSPSG